MAAEALAPGLTSPDHRPAEPARTRAWLLLPAGLCLLVGLDAALLLAELPAPVRSPRLPEVHGMVMVGGFLGSLIALERAVALRRSWAYAAPALLAVGGLLLAAPVPPLLGQLALILGGSAFTLGYAALWRRQRDVPTACLLLAAALLGSATLVWLRVDVERLVPWLLTFLVLTIAAERVDLARISLPRSAEAVLMALSLAISAAATAAVLWPMVGGRLLGALLVVLVGWLVRHDVARRTIRRPGLPRFAATAMLAGYAWLAVAGLVLLVVGDPTGAGHDVGAAGGAAGAGGHAAGGHAAGGHAAYDVVVHAVTLGFAMSMVLAHAPVILPAVLRRPLPYRPILWLPLLVLHAGLAIRVAGSLAPLESAWQTGALVTVVAVLGLPIVVASSVLTGSRR
ncbi:MAG TPA: hypothetical protein P5181_01245 [Dermatophilaceae bacterium]|nr:hypothetical protein [Dermatophilaceae bacterium]